MAQFWVNDTPGGARTLSVPASQASWGQGGGGGDPAAQPGLLCRSLGHPPPHSGGAGPGRVAWGRAGHPLCCLMSPHQSLRGHPQPPQHRAGSSRGAERCLRLRLPQFNLLPNVCHHPQNCNRGPGGCAGIRWPGDAVSLWGGRVTRHHRSPACRVAGAGERVPQSIARHASCKEGK